MEEQHQSYDEANTTPGVRGSIQRLKEKFVPKFKYGLLVGIVANFAMLVIGCVSVHKCPVNENIPLFLIASGAIGLVSKFVSYIKDRIMRHFNIQYIESALYSVEMIFFVLGTYWVYKEFKPSFDPDHGKMFCNKTAYMFAFIYLTIIYMIAIAILLGFLCFLCCAFILARSPTRYDVEAPPENGENVERLTNKTDP